jgi:hypothetical protein
MNISSIFDALQHLGIREVSTTLGKYETTCPQCSHARTKKDHKCLTVWVEREKVGYNCNHCNWHGNVFLNGKGKPNGGGNALPVFYYTKGGEPYLRKVKDKGNPDWPFWWEQPDGKGGWVACGKKAKAKGLKPPSSEDKQRLYRLGEVLEAAAAGKVIAVAEGEKDCDSLWRIGIPATCNPDGASKPGKAPKWKPHHSKQLCGADIIVFGDNDAAGYAHADAVCKCSVGIVNSIKRVDLAKHWEGMPNKADVSDWLAIEGNTPEKLKALIAEAPDYDGAVPTTEVASESDQQVQDFNRKHAVVQVGADVRILSEEDGQPPVFTRVDAFHLRYSNRLVTIGDRTVPASQLWLRSKDRRQYDRVVFDPLDTNPLHYNLWRGFPIKPDPTKSCELFLKHVYDNICAENAEHYSWVLAFLAHLIQRPHEKAGVCLALRSIEGVGKGFFANVIGRLCPLHYLAISQAAHLTGRFNKHQQQALLMFIDEGFWAGDRAGEGTLKHLITDHELLIEPKGIDAFMVRNLTRLIIAGNEHWVVPAGLSARRFCVLDVSPAHANDRAYFSAIEQELQNGGLEALMHVLMTFDLSTVDVHTVPKTAALLEQKEESAAPHIRWWLECLRSGQIRVIRDGMTGFSSIYPWDKELEKPWIWQSYRTFMDDHNIRARRWASGQLHKWLKPLIPGAKTLRPRADNPDRARLVTLPPLDDCRRAFEKLIGQPVDWEQDD